ncbi:acyltransferase family protein [Spirosoma pulveris]
MNKRFHILDGFRGVFALIVALYHFKPGPGIIGHTALISHGWLFVDFFFLLSGFVIYYNYNTLSTITEQKVFLLKRFLRIYPLHFCLLIILLVFETLKIFLFKYHLFNYSAFEQHSLIGFIANVFLIQAYGFPIKGLDYLSWNTSSWSISAEFFAYILFSFLIILVYKYSRITKIFTFFIVSLLSLLCIYYFRDGNMSLKFGIPGIYRCSYSFFLGCIICELYYILVKKNFLINSAKSYFALFSFFEFISMGMSLVSVMYMSEISILSPIFFSITILVFSFELGWVSHKLNTPLFKELGILSYSIYMNNALIKTFFDIIILRLFKVESVLYDLAIIPYVLILFYVSRLTYKYFEVKLRKYLETLLLVPKSLVK